MSTEILSPAQAIVEMIDRMPVDSVLIQHGLSWHEYEELLDAVGEASWLRIVTTNGLYKSCRPHPNTSTLQN